MKKTLAAVVAAASLSLSPLAVAAPAADASAPAAPKGCVTKKEYRQVKKGFTKARVHRIFGTAGISAGKQGSLEARGYKGCTSRYAAVGISYVNGKLAYKTAQW